MKQPTLGAMRRWLGRILASAGGASGDLTTPKSSSAQQAIAVNETRAHLAAGNRLLDAGKLQEAADKYYAALNLDPDSVAALVNLAFVKQQMGQMDPAALDLERVLQLDPGHADALFMLGQHHLAQGRALAAAEILLRLLASHPSFKPGYPSLCRALALEGKASDAFRWVEQGLALDPEMVELHQIKGNLALERRDLATAIASFELATSLAPGSAEAHCNLGAALLAHGHLEAAKLRLKKALHLRPTHAQNWEYLGNTLQNTGLLEDSISAFRQATELEPNRPSAHHLLGLALHHQGLLPLARSSLSRAVELEPQSSQLLHDLAAVLHAMDETPNALDCLRRAQASNPSFAPAYSAQATILVELGDYALAMSLFEKALALNPDQVEARSQQLFVLSFNSSRDNYLRAAREYGECVTQLASPYTEWTADKANYESLRVGLVSGDLRAHPVGFFLEGVLENLQQFGVEVVGFPTHPLEDATTGALKRHCVEWCPLYGMSDAAAAAQIHATRIHVLVDLSGHTAFNRLAVFAWRPAPVQVAWLGYFDSTGVPAISHVLADPVSVPESSRGDFLEEICYLPRTRLCFTAPRPLGGMEVSALPAKKNGHVTLGCSQNLNKLNPGVLSLWQRVFAAMPHARLRIQSRQTAQAGQRQELMHRLLLAGLDQERITIVPPASRTSYLASYADVDFMLDTFPYPGGTTTCEAMWMGVPTLTLAGQTMLGRQGQALLGAVGLHDWIAADEDHYLRLAIANANAIDELAQLRQSLRERLISSPLLDAPAFAHDWAAALRTLWAQRKDG